MKFEFSAGGVIFKKENGHVFVLVSQHSYHHGWVFPKGLIGDKEHIKNESKEETAIREVKEEVGADAKIIQELPSVTYWYKAPPNKNNEEGAFPLDKCEDQKIKKTVYYFLMKYVGGDITEHDHEMEAVEWLPMDQVLKRLTYKSDKDTFKEARPIIEKLANR